MDTLYALGPPPPPRDASVTEPRTQPRTESGSSRRLALGVLILMGHGHAPGGASAGHRPLSIVHIQHISTPSTPSTIELFVSGLSFFSRDHAESRKVPTNSGWSVTPLLFPNTHKNSPHRAAKVVLTSRVASPRYAVVGVQIWSPPPAGTKSRSRPLSARPRPPRPARPLLGSAQAVQASCMSSTDQAI